MARGRSARRTTLCRDAINVGPCGKWLMVMAVGVPLSGVRSHIVEDAGGRSYMPVLVEQNHVSKSLSLRRRN